jgi:hypothetical protein
MDSSEMAVGRQIRDRTCYNPAFVLWISPRWSEVEHEALHSGHASADPLLQAGPQLSRASVNFGSSHHHPTSTIILHSSNNANQRR